MYCNTFFFNLQDYVCKLGLKGNVKIFRGFLSDKYEVGIIKIHSRQGL